jgi:hypothetical protein
VDGQEGGAERDERPYPLADRVADIVQLEVEKYLLAARDEALRKGQSACVGELIADLIKANRIPDISHQLLGLANGRKIKGDDQAVATIRRIPQP